MSTSPLTRVQTSAFTNGSALRIKSKQPKQQQYQMDQISPLKSADDNEQSPSKIINIYANTYIYDNQATFSNVINKEINEDDKILKTCTYSQMTPDEADRAYLQRQKILKDQIIKSKDKQKEFYESKQTTSNKRVKNKQQIDSSTTQSQLIDLSRSSQNFRRKSIDSPPQTQIKPIKNIVKELNQQFHSQQQNKKQQLLHDIAKLDQEILIEQERISVQVNFKKTKQNKSKPINNTQQIGESQQKQRVNTFRNSNTSQNFKMSSRNSLKSTKPKRQVRSQSQEIKEYVDPLKNSKEDLNVRLLRMNEKYNMILEQSNKFRTHFQQI